MVYDETIRLEVSDEELAVLRKNRARRMKARAAANAAVRQKERGD